MDLPIAYSIQTNEYRLSDDMLSVLKENGFLVGLSLDGNRVCHDAHRRDTAGCETRGIGIFSLFRASPR